MDKSKAVEVLQKEADLWRSSLAPYSSQAYRETAQAKIDALDLAIAALRGEGAGEPVAWAYEFNDPDPQCDIHFGPECPSGWPADSCYPLFTHPAPQALQSDEKWTLCECGSKAEAIANGCIPDCEPPPPAGKVRVTTGEHINILRRICVRGRNLFLEKDDSAGVDMFEHMETEVGRLEAALAAQPAGKVRVTEANLVRAWRNRFISERMNAYPDESYEMRRAKAEADANEYEAALEAALAQPGKENEK